MIDTNTVNFAMNKITSVFQSALPTVTNVSAAYVKFLVTQQVVYLIGIVLGIAACAGIWYPIYRACKPKDENSSSSFDEVQFVAPTAILGIIAVVLAICLIPQAMDTILALTNPEMFTVNDIINAAKHIRK